MAGFGNTRYDVMKDLVSTYNKVKGKGNWAQQRDMIPLYHKSRGIFFINLNRTQELWEKKKDKQVVLIRPIHNWSDYVDEDETEYLSENSINLMCDTMVHIENLIEKAHRLNEMLGLIKLIEADTTYKGMHSDMNKRMKELKQLIGDDE